jgi:hypothetical protein
MDTMLSGTAGVPSSQDTTTNSVIRNSDHHTNDNTSNLRMRPVLFSYMVFWVLSKSLQGQI